MTELAEILDGKNLEQLQIELDYQLAQGETLGGTICSEIVWRLANADINWQSKA